VEWDIPMIPLKLKIYGKAFFYSWPFTSKVKLFNSTKTIHCEEHFDGF
jgi:hypothetical protein